MKPASKFAAMSCALLCFFSSVGFAQEEPPVKIGGTVSAPMLVSKVEPHYTEEARKAGVDSSILLSIVVRADGKPSDIKVLKGGGFGLDEKAVEAVSQWRFRPGQKDGHAVAVQAQVEVSFRLLGRWSDALESLRFSVPEQQRPELVKGKMPKVPRHLTVGKLRIHLTVGSDGVPGDLRVLETTDEQWAETAVEQVRKWRFVMHAASGQPSTADGEFEMTVGRVSPRKAK